MKKIVVSLFVFFNSVFSFSQKYEFQEVIDLETLPVLSQGRTGTCWSFSTSSFLESEIIRLNGVAIDLSEMYQVRTTYPKKAENYVMRQGKAQFSEGALAHDVINSVREFGIVPSAVYSGLKNGEEKHNHAELVAVLKAMVQTYVANPAKKLSVNWQPAIASVLDIYLGEMPTTFTFEGKNYTPKSFAETYKINADNYITLTSFINKPYYSKFILNIPDNFSNGSMYNVPLDALVSTIDNALDKGFSVALDCDVSEKTFSAKHGVAFIPENNDDAKLGLTEIIEEKEISPEFRLQEFQNFTTTDDHLMHIVGKVKDQNGTTYYKVKNSWGATGNRVSKGGHIYMSVPYIKLKTIAILLHKDGIDKKLYKKLKK